MTRIFRIISPISLCAMLVACGGSSGKSGDTGTSNTDTVIAALTVDAVSSSSATLSFSTTPAADANIRVWLGTDEATAEPLFVVTSDSAVNHSEILPALWSAAPWRVEISAGTATSNTTFRTADPGWPAVCRSGDLTLPLNGAGSWSTFTDVNGSIAVEAASGCEGAGTGARLTYDLRDGEWVVAASNDSFASPVDLSTYSHLWIPFRGTAGVPLAFEIKLRDNAGALSVARIDGGAGVPVWRSWAVDKREFVPQIGTLDFTAITALEFALSWPLAGGGPRNGTLEVASPSAWNLTAERPEVPGFERVARNDGAMAAIAADLLARQQPHGFIPAWFEIAPDWHLFANAMALIVFTLEYERLTDSSDPGVGAYLDAAYLLADQLVELQQLSARNGAWDDSFRQVNGDLELHPVGSRQVWVGSTAWAGIALITARDGLPDGNRYDSAIVAATQFYSGEQSCRATAGLPAGSVTEGTEGNISSHLFLAAAAERGLTSAAVPDALSAFIADHLFDPQQRRFFCGVQVDFGSGYDSSSCTLGGSGAVIRGDARSCLDVTGNWGVEWLKRQGRSADALLGLAYSRHIFPTRGFSDAGVKGLGDIAGPWTPTVEHGAGQWAASGGPDANYVMAEANAKLCREGACQGAADDLTAGIGWNTVSTGIAPGAWMYLAWHGGFWSRL
ncbi:MAG: hypothetical protein OEQ14_10940 [Gammaproteobacteria bacterium]|nr:hypothetical protein [Gammaproteobacteria bacterium]